MSVMQSSAREEHGFRMRFTKQRVRSSKPAGGGHVKITNMQQIFTVDGKLAERLPVSWTSGKTPYSHCATTVSIARQTQTLTLTCSEQSGNNFTCKQSILCFMCKQSILCFLCRKSILCFVCKQSILCFLCKQSILYFVQTQYFMLYV